MATELEMLERAKLYMEKLANGINPIDDTEAGENDCINNVRLSRCFFYVADVLGKVIENGGIIVPSKSNKAKRIPFNITDDKLADFEFSNNPISISEIAKRINILNDNDDIKKITYNNIADWLVSVGMLEICDVNKSKRRVASEKGKKLGIIMEKRIGSDGEYMAVLYSRAAQQFIIDNIEAVVDSINKKKGSVA